MIAVGPGEIGRNELISYFALNSEDRVRVQRSARSSGNRLGLAERLGLRRPSSTDAVNRSRPAPSIRG